MLSELLIDSQDGKIDVREGGVICAMLCGADDAQATFAYAAELYSLGPLQETDDVSRMSFVMQSYSMFRAFWKVSVHIASSFITSFRTIDSSEILQREMLQSTTMRLGLYLDIIIRTFQQTNLRETNWQEQMDAKVGHVQWLAALCAAFASSMAGILVAADPLEKEAFALPSSNQLKEYGKAFAYTPPSSPTATSKSMEPEPESEGEDGVNKSDTAWAIRAPSFEGELQHGKSMATAYFKLQIVRGQGVCLCKYKNQKEAMAEVAKAGGAKGVTKTRLPLFAVKRVTKLQSDATERIKVKEQTNRFEVVSPGIQVPGLSLSTVRCETSFDDWDDDDQPMYGAMTWIEQIEYYAPLACGLLEISTGKDCTEEFPKKWKPHYVTVQRGAILLFSGKEASIKPANPPFLIDGNTRVRVVPQAIIAAKQPWLELKLDHLQDYKMMQYLELSNDEGRRPTARLFLRSPPKVETSKLPNFLKALHSAGFTPQVSEGIPPDEEGVDQL
jgi:hypothetical protein